MLQQSKSKHDLDTCFTNLVRILLGKKDAKLTWENAPEVHDVKIGITLTHKGQRYCDSTIPGRHFSNIVKIVKAEENEPNHNENLFAPKLVTYLEVFMMPFCGVGASTKSTRASNSTIENWHRALKTDICNKRLPIAEFIETMQVEIKGRVNAYVHPELQVPKRSNKKRKIKSEAVPLEADKDDTELQETWARRPKGKKSYYKIASTFKTMIANVPTFSSSLLLREKKIKKESAKKLKSTDKGELHYLKEDEVEVVVVSDDEVEVVDVSDEGEPMQPANYGNLPPEEKRVILNPFRWLSSDSINPFMQLLKKLTASFIIYNAFGVHFDQMVLNNVNDK